MWSPRYLPYRCIERDQIDHDLEAPVTCSGTTSTYTTSSLMACSTRIRSMLGAVLLSALPMVISAQGAYRVEPSGRVTTVIKAAGEGLAPATVSIDYGQPHLRGRDVATLIPLGKVWRLGANSATTLVTSTSLVIGGTTIPKGTYTLFLQRENRGGKLIVSKQTGQWGTEYDATKDLARIDLSSAAVSQPLESLQVALIPAQSGPGGVLRITWGNMAFESSWSLKP